MFVYVIKTNGMSVSLRIFFTIEKKSSILVPLFNDSVLAICIIGPSAIGSENGNPNSIISVPPLIKPLTADNVAFSDGSLLQGFNSRIAKKQPIAAPFDVRRYFITPEESGELCLISGLLGQNRDILFPKLTEKLHEKTFSEIAQNYLNQIGYEPFLCQSEEEARRKTKELIPNKIWPCYFFKSDTTGEKDFEEFFTDKEEINMDKFKEIGVIKNSLLSNPKDISLFKKELKKLEERKSLERKEIVNLFSELLPEFNHIEKGKFLDEKM